MATLVQTPPERPSLHHRDRLWGLHTLDMADSNADHRPVESDSRLDSPARNSPASAVCYLDMSEAHPHSAQNITSRDGESSSTGDHDFESPEGDSTPRSEVPSVPSVQSLQSLPATYKTSILQQQPQGLDAEPDYFSPQPLRLYSSNIAQSTPASTDPSPTISVNASTTSIDRPESVPTDNRIGQSSAATAHLDRPLFPPRDLSSASTASVATVRANSVDPILHTPPSRSIRDGPVYPNQSYAALQYQQYPSVHMPPILRSRSSHPAHFSGHSISGLSSFGFNADFPFHRDIMESGSRTVGNSPASSPGLFDPTASAARRVKQPIDFSHTYSTPWLHHTHRQAPKETHIADVDVDPVSGRKLVNQYEFIDELGRGVHGKVKLGRNLKDGNFVAIKIVDRYSKRRRLGKNTSHEDKIKREIAILKKARHPNIVSLLEVIDDPAKKKVYIVLEHVELGEVKWRTEGAKEICLVEWRRFKRESEGIFDNESAVLEDEKILKLAHQKLERQHRKTKEAQQQRSTTNENEPWSFEHGGESEDEYSEAGRSSRASVHGEERSSSHIHFVEQQTDTCGHEDNMETAFRSATPTTHTRHEDQNIITELEGTMYGAYDTELYRGRTPSVTGSNSSHITDGDEEVPEHFRYVPLMTIQGAREAFRDTVLGLEYLHYQGVIHRDIKPANLLQTKEHRIKISDFGVSYLGRPTSNESTGEQSESDMQDIDEALELAKTVGTPAFYAPELCRTETDIDTPRIDGKIDVWALGVTLYCLIYGRVPFHDHNTFVLMRLISETEPYIPTYRLKAVAERTTSRPNSHGRSYQQMTTAKRAPHDLDFEEVDVHLRDLLQRLLTKDPQQRISIKEIKRHPWLAQDIDNFNSWVEETDPGRSALGRKIEVSRDDVEKAVIPINFIDRVRSGVKKTYDTVTKALTRGASRRRAQSSATDLDGQASISAHSSSSTISQEGRRSSLAPPGASLLEALSRSRESEHPLSQSISANHEGKDRLRYLERTNSRTTSPAHSVEGHDQATALPSLFRPQPPERSYSTISSAASVRTVRQTDMQGRGRAVSPIVPSALPGTPTALESPGGSNLGGLFGGMTRTVVNKMRSRELLKPSKEHSHLRTKSIDRLVGGDDDAHGAPSLAISPTVVAGRVDQPNVLQNLSPSVARGVSPSYKDLQSSDPTERASSRQSSVSSMSSRLHRTWATQHELETGPTLDMPPKISRETSEDRFSRAKDEFVRRRVREETFNRERIPSATRSRPSSAVVPAVCPPSPDDDAFYRRQKIEDYLYHQQTSSDTSPVSHPINIQTGPKRVLTSSSSEDQFTPMSQSTSNPSIPSVASANSSAPDDYMQMKQSVGIVSTASADSMHFNQFDAPIDDPAGYDGDHAIESEEDEESDEEDFIVMGKKKRPTDAPRSESIANGELARSSIRKELTSRRRSARSGSGGTVKKIPPPGINGDEKNSEPVVH